MKGLYQRCGHWTKQQPIRPTSPPFIFPPATSSRLSCVSRMTTPKFLKIGIGATIVVFLFLFYQLAVMRYPYNLTQLRHSSDPHIRSGALQVHGAYDCVWNINTTALVSESIAMRRSCEKSPPPINSLRSQGPRIATFKRSLFHDQHHWYLLPKVYWEPSPTPPSPQLFTPLTMHTCY